MENPLTKPRNGSKIIRTPVPSIENPMFYQALIDFNSKMEIALLFINVCFVVLKMCR